MGQQIYAHPVKPENYPDFKERHAKAVTREALNNEIQFTSLRVFSTDNNTKMLTDIKGEIDLYTKTFRLGNVLWPVYKTLFAENFKELAEEVQKRGLYMFDFWGYVPGSQPQEDVIWGEYAVPRKAHDALKQLGNHFLGFDNGEQDGRYIGGYAKFASPVADSRKKQYQNFQEHFEKLGNAMKNYMVTLSSLPFLHYFAKEGNTIMLGAETAQALPNSSMWFSFIRGAAKQYGLLMFGNASIYNRWGYKCYESAGKEGGYAWGEDCGTSLSLLRRLIYSHYVYGCEILGFENGWIMGDSVEKRLKNEEVLMDSDKSTCTLTPVGKIQQYCGEFVRKYGRPGTLYTPLAIVTNFFAGWNPPRHLYTKDIYKVWGNLPYRSGDYQLHGLFSMLYPGYENAGFFRDESGFLTPTPYGEIADVLLNDVRYEILSQYGAALVTNDTELTLEFYELLKQYVQTGGDLILFADTLNEALAKIKQYDADAARFFGIEELGTESEKAYTVCYNEADYSEKGKIYSVKPLAGAEILSADDHTPLVLSSKFGSGTVTVFLMSDGLVDNGGYSAENEPNKNICKPMDFSAFVKAYLGDVFGRLSLARPDNRDLQYCAAVKDEKTLTLYVSNSSFEGQSFMIDSGEYGISSVHELPIEDGISEDEQFFPFHSTAAKEENKSDGYFLKCGDTKIFEVKLKKPLALKSESVPKANQNNLYLSITGFSGSVKEFVLNHPTLQHHFKGVMIPSEYLHRLEAGEAAREAEYLNRKNVRVLVDFSAALDHYPGLSLLDNLPERKAESMVYIQNVLDKAAKYRCEGILLQMHRNAECSFSTDKAKQNFVDAFAQIAEIVNEYGITVYAQNRPVLTETAEFFDLIKDIPDVKPAFNYSNSVCAGDNAVEIAKQFDGSMILLSAPAKDGFGQFYNMRLPIAGSGYEDEISARRKDGAITVLAADYKDWDEVYKDLNCLGLC